MGDAVSYTHLDVYKRQVVGSKYMRQVRLVILEEMQKDYVIGARARGVSEMKILFGHILPNACLLYTSP